MNKAIIIAVGILVIGGIFGFVFWQDSQDRTPVKKEEPKARFGEHNNEDQIISNVRDERDKKRIVPEDRTEKVVVQNQIAQPQAQPKELPVASVRSFGNFEDAANSQVGEQGFANAVSNTTENRTDWRYTAPYGRLLKCSLMNTLQSIDLATPIIAVVEEDLVWDGEVIIPAGTEVHGTATEGRSRDRLGANGNWLLVMKEDKYNTRRELRLNGVVLERSYDAKTDKFGELDGSSGFKGRVIENVDDELIRLYAATFIQGLSGAFTETSTNDSGTVQILPSARNAAIGGTTELLGEIAARIRAEIEREGFYVQVPGGSEFYLYITQGVDRDSAKTGISINAPYNPDDRIAQANAAAEEAQRLSDRTRQESQRVRAEAQRNSEARNQNR